MDWKFEWIPREVYLYNATSTSKSDLSIRRNGDEIQDARLSNYRVKLEKFNIPLTNATS